MSRQWRLIFSLHGSQRDSPTVLELHNQERTGHGCQLMLAGGDGCTGQIGQLPVLTQNQVAAVQDPDEAVIGNVHGGGLGVVGISFFVCNYASGYIYYNNPFESAAQGNCSQRVSQKSRSFLVNIAEDV